MDSQDILFETSRFNLSEVKQHFINPCCFGEDVVQWLREKLSARGVSADEPGQEDWGWYTWVTLSGQTYFIGVGGNPDGDNKNHGEWRIFAEKRRSLWQMLSGKNRMSPDDEMVALLLDILRREPDFSHVGLEFPQSANHS